MLFDVDIDTVFDPEWTVSDGGKAIAFIIDENVVHTMAAKNNFIDLILNFQSSTDIEERVVIDLTNKVILNSNSDENTFILDFVKNGDIIEQVSTSQEILNAILLSDPKIVILRPEIKRIGVEPGWKYINEIFIK